MAAALGILAIKDAFAARSDLSRARAAIQRLEQSLDRPVSDLRPDLKAAFDSIERAGRKMERLPIRLVSGVPFLGRSAKVARDLTRSASTAVDAVSTAVDGAGQVQGPDGQVELSLTGAGFDATKWRRAQSAFQAASKEAARAAEIAEGSHSRFTLGAIDRVRTQVIDATRRLTKAVSSAAAASELVPKLLGAQGDRRYLLVLQNPGEARATGGLIGGFALLESNNGKLDLVEIASNYELTKASSPVEAPQWFGARYDRFNARRNWSNVNVEADYRVTAGVMRKLFERLSGSKLDGVFALDPFALAAFLKVTGPIEGPPVKAPPAKGASAKAPSAKAPSGIELRAETFPKLAMHDAYEIFGADTQGRKLWFAAAMRLVFERVLNGGYGSALARAVGEAATGKHLLAWSADPNEQKLYERLGASGRFDGAGAPFAGVVVQNAAANKVDYFLKRRLDFDIALKEDQSADITLTAVLTNTIPPEKTKLPHYVPNPPVRDVGPGGNKTFLSIYLSPNALPDEMTDDGRAIDFESAGAPHAFILSKYFIVPPGGSKTVTLKWNQPGFVPARDGGPIRFIVRGQPLVVPAQTTVVLRRQGSPWGLTPYDLRRQDLRRQDLRRQDLRRQDLKRQDLRWSQSNSDADLGVAATATRSVWRRWFGSLSGNST